MFFWNLLAVGASRDLHEDYVYAVEQEQLLELPYLKLSDNL